MTSKELMKQCLGAVFVGCHERFGHFGRIGYTPCRRVLCNVSNDLLVFGAPEPPPGPESECQRVRVRESESELEGSESPERSKKTKTLKKVHFVETNYLPFGLGQGNCFSSRGTLFPRVAGPKKDSEASILTLENP